MLWKVYHIDSGKTVRAGFTSEDDAKEWLEARSEDLDDVYEVDEMDQDEIDEWEESQDDADFDDEDDDEDIEDKNEVGFGDDYYDGADLEEEELSTVFEDDDL